MKKSNFNPQPDLINSSRITYTLFFTSSVFNQIFDLLDLYSARLLSFGTPYQDFPALWSAQFTIPTDSLNPLLSLLPVDCSLPSHLQAENYPPDHPNATNAIQTKTEDQSVTF